MSGPIKSGNDHGDEKRYIKPRSALLSCLIAALLFGTACTAGSTDIAAGSDGTASGSEGSASLAEASGSESSASWAEASGSEGSASWAEASGEITAPPISLAEIPSYSGDLWAVINKNVPFFTDEEKTTEVFEEYSELDSLGRCGTAYANICEELMPTEARGDISDIHPTGWHSSFYDFVDEESLYNRCHLIAHELAGEDANERNLITGTRTFNKDGMQPYENMVADYVHETGNHVLYRVTPMFEGNDLVADGVLMEAYSVEDDGEGICYCVFCYNVEPGVGIDYATGDNWLDVGDDYTYILNTNNMKFHLSTCPGVEDIAAKNRQEYTGSRDDLLEMGYSPCKTCNP